MTILNSRDTGQLEGGPSFSLGNRATRAIWNVAWLLLASWTPAPLHSWRRFLLRCFGAKVGRSVRVYGSAKVWLPRNLVMDDYSCLGPRSNCYNQANVEIKARAIISQGAHICTGSHDIGDPNFQLWTRPIIIGEHAWVAAEAFVGPGVEIGDGAVLAARAVAMRSIPPWQVFGGNPATFLKERRLRTR